VSFEKGQTNKNTNTTHVLLMVLIPRPFLLSWGAGLSEAVHVLNIWDFHLHEGYFTWNDILTYLTFQSRKRSDFHSPSLIYSESPGNSSEKLSVVRDL